MPTRASPRAQVLFLIAFAISLASTMQSYAQSATTTEEAGSTARSGPSGFVLVPAQEVSFLYLSPTTPEVVVGVGERSGDWYFVHADVPLCRCCNVLPSMVCCVSSRERCEYAGTWWRPRP